MAALFSVVTVQHASPRTQTCLHTHQRELMSGVGDHTRKRGPVMSKDRGQKAAKKPAASTAKEKKAAKRAKNDAATSMLDNRK